VVSGEQARQFSHITLDDSGPAGCFARACAVEARNRPTRGREVAGDGDCVASELGRLCEREAGVARQIDDEVARIRVGADRLPGDLRR
jgi:hypothetical protein